jgi:hypothetical protein
LSAIKTQAAKKNYKWDSLFVEQLWKWSTESGGPF